jgi:hypothetical protein
MPGRTKPAAAAFLAAGLVLAGLAAGCSGQSGTSRASVESCVQFGIAAIRHHVTVTSLPPACRGLTGAQIDFAVGSALHTAAIGAHGKVRQRERIAKASHYLEHLVVSVPAQRGEPQVLVPAAHQISRTALGLIALFTWLITVALGLWMMIRWILRGRPAPAATGLGPCTPGACQRKPAGLDRLPGNWRDRAGLDSQCPAAARGRTGHDARLPPAAGKPPLTARPLKLFPPRRHPTRPGAIHRPVGARPSSPWARISSSPPQPSCSHC